MICGRNLSKFFLIRGWSADPIQYNNGGCRLCVDPSDTDFTKFFATPKLNQVLWWRSTTVKGAPNSDSNKRDKQTGREKTWFDTRQNNFASLARWHQSAVVVQLRSSDRDLGMRGSQEWKCLRMRIIRWSKFCGCGSKFSGSLHLWCCLLGMLYSMK